MTRTSHIEQTDRTNGKKAATQQERSRSASDAAPTAGGEATRHNGRASEATPRPRRVEGPHTIPQSFERMNAPQMLRDRFNAFPPLWLLVVSALTCVFTLLAADTLYTMLFEWLTGGSP